MVPPDTRTAPDLPEVPESVLGQEEDPANGQGATQGEGGQEAGVQKTPQPEAVTGHENKGLTRARSSGQQTDV